MRIPSFVASLPLSFRLPFRTSHTAHISPTPQLCFSSLSSTPSISSAISVATHLFTRLKTPEPSASALHLARFAFSSLNSTSQFFSEKSPPPADQLANYIHLCEQRAEHRIPVQYLVGEWDFHHITLRVRAPVLIPRPETEELVEFVLNDIKEDEASVLDVGVGSGCILLALLKARPRWVGWGLDPVQEAHDLCVENAVLLGVESRAKVICGRVGSLEVGDLVDVLVSNPPYIPRGEMEQLEKEVRDHEDDRALCGGEDGMDVIREVLMEAPRLVKRGGSVWLEVDSNQPETLEITRFEGLKFINWFKDLYERPRFVHFRVL